MESDQTLFRAKFPYQPENADEIALQKGTLTFDSKFWDSYNTDNLLDSFWGSKREK